MLNNIVITGVGPSYTMRNIILFVLILISNKIIRKALTIKKRIIRTNVESEWKIQNKPNYQIFSS